MRQYQGAGVVLKESSDNILEKLKGSKFTVRPCKSGIAVYSLVDSRNSFITTKLELENLLKSIEFNGETKYKLFCYVSDEDPFANW
jgi:hypothetical protein